jgi:hypothetical protein
LHSSCRGSAGMIGWIKTALGWRRPPDVSLLTGRMAAMAMTLVSVSKAASPCS